MWRLIKRGKKVKIHFKGAMVTTKVSGVITTRTMLLLNGLKWCMFPMETLEQKE